MNTHAAVSIARAAVARVNPVAIVRSRLALNGSQLTVQTSSEPLVIDLAAYRRVVVLGAGKAGAAMAQGLEAVLGDRLSEGLVVTKYGHGLPLHTVELLEAGHPVPDDNSLAAGRAIASRARALTEEDLCITLVSGGGSALLTLPAEFPAAAVSLADVQATTELLLGAGAPIQDVNCLRRHLSGIAGGRFIELAAPARVLALVLSDVVGDQLESIASGLVAPDPTTYQDAEAVCHRYGIHDRLPPGVANLVAAGIAGDVPDTPGPEASVFRTVDSVVIGSNRGALEAAAEEARSRGYNTVVLTSQLTGEAREIAKLFSAMAADIARDAGPVSRPACILAGGETTVTLRGNGLGGRNQEMALGVLAEIAPRPTAYRGMTFLSVGTDGSDGPTDAAGGFAAPEYAGEVDAVPRIADALARNDAYHLLDELGALYRSGPTNTNVCDIQILLVD